LKGNIIDDTKKISEKMIKKGEFNSLLALTNYYLQSGNSEEALLLLKNQPKFLCLAKLARISDNVTEDIEKFYNHYYDIIYGSLI
jgi:hypothetical protein